MRKQQTLSELKNFEKQTETFIDGPQLLKMREEAFLR
jgi:hypothetical protein